MEPMRVIGIPILKETRSKLVNRFARRMIGECREGLELHLHSESIRKQRLYHLVL